MIKIGLLYQNLMNLEQYLWCYWQALLRWSSLFCFLGLDASKDILESGHVREKGVGVILQYVVEPDPGEVTFDSLLFEFLLTEVCRELTQGGFSGGVWSDLAACTKVCISAVAGGV